MNRSTQSTLVQGAVLCHDGHNRWRICWGHGDFARARWGCQGPSVPLFCPCALKSQTATRHTSKMDLLTGTEHST
eukprot:1254396-Amphidinium_carterae.1